MCDGADIMYIVAMTSLLSMVVFFFQAEDGIRDYKVTGVQTCALPICPSDAEAQRAGLTRGAAAVHGGVDVVGLLEAGEAQRLGRSEERRVGKECRSRWGAEQEKKK